MKFAIVALIGAVSAIQLHKDAPSLHKNYNSYNERIPSNFQANNKDILENDAYIRDKNLFVQTKWVEDAIPEPVENHCTNANKATAEDETCSTAGNSAWNTHTSSRTAKPTNAQAAPYPETLPGTPTLPPELPSQPTLKLLHTQPTPN